MGGLGNPPYDKCGSYSSADPKLVWPPIWLAVVVVGSRGCWSWYRSGRGSGGQDGPTAKRPYAPWSVFWGGDTKELNQHHDTLNQRYAFDLLVTDDAGKSHRGDGKRNEDYFAFGQPVLAPADGVVTEAITGVRDNTPGSMNPYSALGNAVIIEHRPQEVSVLAHFQQGSIRVKAGDHVTAGQVLGLCGNSGNSSEAHIHYHLQNTPIIQDGTGIRCLFDKVRVMKDGDSEVKENYSPVKGDLIKRPK
jgi:hypothetical protein